MEKAELITLRQYINSSQPKSFLNLIQKVDFAMQKYHQQGLTIIDINLDQIKINATTGQIVFPAINTFDPLEKTIASYQTGISINSERKSSQSHNENSIALMILGWYVNEDKSAIRSDLEAVENYDLYTAKSPEWIKPYFNERLRKMGSMTNFSEYYEQQFLKKIQHDLEQSFIEFNLRDEEKQQILKSVISNINNHIKDLLNKSEITKDDFFGFYEQYALNRFATIQQEIIEKLDLNDYASQEDNNSTTNANQTNRSNSLVKSLTKPGVSLTSEEIYNSNENLYEGQKINSNEGGSGFSTILALVMIIFLVALVSVTSLLFFATIR